MIDKSGSWIFQTSHQQIYLAIARNGGSSEVPYGWHFKQADHWGLLDLDGRTVLDAAFDQPVQHCEDKRLIAYKNKQWLYFTEGGNPLQPPGSRLIDATCGAAPPYTLQTGDTFQLVDARLQPIAPMQFEAVVRIDGMPGMPKSMANGDASGPTGVGSSSPDLTTFDQSRSLCRVH